MEYDYLIIGGEKRIRCDICPRCTDPYPGKMDRDGYHFHVCGNGGNIVYTTPHRIKRYNGKGYINLGVSSCALYESIEDALAHMTESEIRRWREGHEAHDNSTVASRIESDI